MPSWELLLAAGPRGSRAAMLPRTVVVFLRQSPAGARRGAHGAVRAPGKSLQAAVQRSGAGAVRLAATASPPR